MKHMNHDAHAEAADPHAGHQMSHDHSNHDRHAGHSVAMFRDKFWLSFALTIPTVFWSSEVQHWLGYTAPSFPGSLFIPAIFGTAVFLYGGLGFGIQCCRRFVEHEDFNLAKRDGFLLHMVKQTARRGDDDFDAGA